MKIRRLNNHDSAAQMISRSEQRLSAPEKTQTFRRAFEQISGPQAEEYLTALVGNIDAQGAKLVQKADLTEFEKYRALIRDFIDRVVTGGYEFSRENFYGARGRNKFYATVRVINEKLDNMARDLISNHSDSIETFHSVEDIRGLILDLLM